jgi:hypothetical protein
MTLFTKQLAPVYCTFILLWFIKGKALRLQPWRHTREANALAVPWLRRLVAGLPLRRPGFDPRSVHVVILVDKVTLGQVFSPRILQFSPVNCIPPVLHYTEKQKKLIIFITGLHKKPQGCGASVASAAGPFTTKKAWRHSLLTLAIYGGDWSAIIDNVVPVHAMKAYRGRSGIAPVILNLGAKWRWVVNITPRPYYPQKEPREWSAIRDI